LEVILKNRNAPQLRILHNSMKDIGKSIAFRLRGHTSNRDAIGTAITVETGTLRQTKYLQAGSGFLAQHSKELFFGLGNPEGAIRAVIHWPSGSTQEFSGLPANHRIEIEEDSAEFTAKPFAVTVAAYAQAGPSPVVEPLPSQVGTWLIEPLKASAFSLPDLAGNMRELRSFYGGFVLLNFWATTAPVSLDQLRLLNRRRQALAAGQITVLAVNVNETSDVQAARSFATKEALFFPALFATGDVAGIYNIIYHHLFDRRRNLGIPTSFLLDREGKIVKAYQGTIDLEHLLEDVKSIPNTAADRMKKALPFNGQLFQDAFSRNEFTYGVAFFQHGYLDQAAEFFLEAVASKPDDPDAYYNLGTLSLRRNKFVEARSYLEQALKLRPNYPEAWNNLGMMAAQEGHPDEAIQNFQQSLRLRPRYAIALLNLGNVYRRQRDFDKAEKSLSDDPEISYGLGMLYARRDRMQRASEYLQKAIDLRPDYPEALNNLGVLLVRSHDYSRAEETFKTGIRVAPDYDQLYLNLARLYAMRNNKDQAKAVLLELLRIRPQDEGARKVLDTLQ
jgi:Flp pilus assembly protein TadD/peroxiredoxin